MVRTPSSSTLIIYRTLLVIGGIGYLAFWFLLTNLNHSLYDPLLGRCLISALILLSLVLSYTTTFFKNRIVSISYVLGYILTLYYIFLLIKNNYSHLYAIGMMTVLFGIAVVFKESLGLLIYLLTCLICVGAGFRFVETPEEDPFLYMSILVTTSIVSFLTMGIRLNTQKKLRDQHRDIEQAYHLINEQKRIVDKKNEDITDSINYARKIQQAILPSEDAIPIVIPKSFMYYHVKDIVSGDFFWYTKLDDERIIAAVDCTGHGVPGALVSMVGVTLLNQIVEFKRVTKPGKILTNLQREIYSFLQRGSSDGMDVAICAINKVKMQLSYAGGIMPLIMIRDNELTVIKGDRFSLSRNTDERAVFTNHTIDVKEGDMFYIFTDGYCDQFGGDKVKKFMIKRFKQLLLEIHKEDIDTQKAIIEKTHLEWRGTQEQVDDILVIGFRI